MKLTATAVIANILDKLDKTLRFVLNEHFHSKIFTEKKNLQLQIID